MSGPMDLLGVIDCAANSMRDMGCTNRQLATVQTNALRRAIPVANGLIEALEVLLRGYEAVHGTGDLEMQPAIFQARRALENAGIAAAAKPSEEGSDV